MKRRFFLQRMATACASSLLLPSFLSSCSEEDTPLYGEQPLAGRHIIVVGAGVSGLYTAYLLQQQGANVTILEASNRYGGRVRYLEGFSDFPIELGAEEVHGSKSIWYDLLKPHKPSFVTEETEDLFLIDGNLLTEEDLEKDPKYVAAMDLLEKIEGFSGDDQTAKAWVEANVDPKYHNLMNALMGNEHGTSNSRLGMAGLAREERSWTANDDNFLLKGQAHLKLLEETFADVLDKIKLNHPVESIDYQSAKAKVKVKSGATFEADAVVVTVPLAVFGNIAYTPTLPAIKQESRDVLGMDTGMKILLQFSKRFWPASTGSIYGGNYVPEFWSTGAGRSAANNVLTAFVHGEKAELLSAMSEGAVGKAIEDLKSMFGSNLDGATLTKSYIMDWSKEAYIGGTYSYPKVGSNNANFNLAEPVAGKLFFAGEATNYNGHFGTVHGALETGYRVATEILETFKIG